MRVAVSLALLAAGLALGAVAWARPHGGARLFVRPRPAVWGLWFNPTSPAFGDNPQLVRAINYALDRPALIRAWGRYAGHPTARLIPGTAGQSPYPLTEPDLDFAHTVAEGHLPPTSVTLGVYGTFLARVANEVQRELAGLGVDVKLLNLRVICRPCPEPDMTIGAWEMDYPDPASALWPYGHNSWGLTPLAASPWKERLASASALGGESRARAFAQLDYDLMKLDPPIAPFMTQNAAFLVSGRTHCIRWNAFYGVDLAAVCLS
jgi:Bacterial extracellular solute-binding proteins, family 5 Middle